MRGHETTKTNVVIPFPLSKITTKTTPTIIKREFKMVSKNKIVFEKVAKNTEGKNEKINKEFLIFYYFVCKIEEMVRIKQYA